MDKLNLSDCCNEPYLALGSKELCSKCKRDCREERKKKLLNRGLVALLLILILFSSCSQKVKTKVSEDKKEHTEITTTEKSNEVTTTTVTEKADTFITVEADSLTTEIDSSYSYKPVIIENENIKVVVTTSKGKTVVKAIKKEKAVPVQIDKTTTSQTVKNTELVAFEKTDTKVKKSETVKTKKPISLFKIGLGIAGFLVFLLLFILAFRFALKWAVGRG